MRDLKKFLFKSGAATNMPNDLRAAVDAWRASPAPALDDVHFHTRYVVLDITSSGVNPETDKILSIAASSVRQGTIVPADAFFLDCLAPAGDDAATMETTAGPRTIKATADRTVDRQLMAFLQFIAKAPIVTYHVPYVGGFLQRACKERLGIDFQPLWVDLAWLLPAMFEDKGDSVMPLDYWIEAFGLDAGSSRRNAMENTLMLARIFLMLLVRAGSKQVDTAARLVDESLASSFLFRTH